VFPDDRWHTNFKTMLGVLELCEGVLGLLWLVTVVATVVSLVGAMLFSWPWSRFGWLLGTSFVGKHLLLNFLRIGARKRGEL
jgi:hypothetical protein